MEPKTIKPKAELEERFLKIWTELKGPKLKRNYQFHPLRRWKFDFVWLDGMIAIEIEGGTFGGKPCAVCKQRPGGRHNSGAGFQADCVKYNAATLLNYRVFRFTRALLRPRNVEPLVKYCERIEKFFNEVGI